MQTGIQTKDKLDRLTVIPVIFAASVGYTHVIVFPGKKAHYRHMQGETQTLNEF